MAQCVSNRCNDLFERKKDFGVRCTLSLSYSKKISGASIEIDQPEEEGEQTIKTLRSA